MKFIPQSIPDVFLVEPKVHGDQRGYFVETFRHDLFQAATGFSVDFVQDNESSSSRGVLRGLHFQLAPYAQNKLVRVIQGEVLDVAVDIRTGSPTFGQHVSAVLNDKNKHQLFIPCGFAHAFVVLSEQAIFVYKVDKPYSPECERGLAWDDPSLGIEWGIASDEVKLSPKDKQQPKLKELGRCFDYEVNSYA